MIYKSSWRLIIWCNLGSSLSITLVCYGPSTLDVFQWCSAMAVQSQYAQIDTLLDVM